MDIDPVRIDPGTPAEVIGTLLQKLQAYYIFPEIAAKLCNSLQEHLENGDHCSHSPGHEVIPSVVDGSR
jgi:hypothetical protein